MLLLGENLVNKMADLDFLWKKLKHILFKVFVAYQSINNVSFVSFHDLIDLPTLSIQCHDSTISVGEIIHFRSFCPKIVILSYLAKKDNL